MRKRAVWLVLGVLCLGGCLPLSEGLPGDRIGAAVAPLR